MHIYDYLCNDCQHRFSLQYKTYAEYDVAVPVCPVCNSKNLSRIIPKIAIQQHTPDRDYRAMSAGELNAAIHSPDSKAVGEIFRQMIESEPDITPEFQEVTKRLLKGESKERVEREVAIPDKTPEGTGLARELLDFKLRHDEHHHDHDE